MARFLLGVPRPRMAFFFILLPLLLLMSMAASGKDGAGTHQLIQHVHTDTTIRGDTVIPKTDTLPLSKISKDSLDAPVNYEAEDSVVLDVPSKTITLHNKSQIRYKDITLQSKYVSVDQSGQTLVAYPGTDSTGAYMGRPHFEQGESKVDSDTMRYNFKTGKGLAKGSYTTSGELYVYSEKSKRPDSKTFYGYNSNLTTCNLDTPHFAFKARKIKVINDKWGFSGPVHPEFEGVPIPIWLPFGIFPMSRGRHSGMIAPTFSPTENFGLGLTGGGYYKVINDYWDLRVTGDIYSYGSWNLYVVPTYRKRYKYNGSMSFTLRNTRLNFPGDPDYVKNQTFGLTWSHAADTRARPGVNFSANVNFVNNKNFNFFNPLVPMNNFNNQFASSIMYSKTWQNKPYSLTFGANHSQNTQNRLINLDLPNIGFNVNNIFPFKRKDAVGSQKWYERISVGYQGQLIGRIALYDSNFTFRKMLDTVRWGATHNFPLAMSLPPAGPFQITPTISYQENWTDRKITRSWNNVTRKMDTLVQRGIYRSANTGFGLSVNTQIFGTYQFTDTNARLIAIRHIIRPSIGFTYRPDLNSKNFYTTQVDTTGRTARFSHFENAVLGGAFSENVSGSISFGVDNFLEAKVRSRKDSTVKEKKLSLIDGFGFSGSYDLLRDSLNLSDLQFNLRSTLFQKLNITGGFTLVPYVLDSNDQRLNTYAWQNGRFKLGTITSASLAFSTSFSGGNKQKQKEAKALNRSQDYPMTLDEQQRMLDQIQRNPGEFADFNVPWSLNLNYSLTISRQLRGPNKGAFNAVTQFLTLNGDFNFAPKWKVGANTFLDITNRSIQTFTLFVTRDMHCWQMSINVTPVGLWRSFNLTINPKSALLRDLRINRTRIFQGF